MLKNPQNVKTSIARKLGFQSSFSKTLGWMYPVTVLTIHGQSIDKNYREGYTAGRMDDSIK